MKNVLVLFFLPCILFSKITEISFIEEVKDCVSSDYLVLFDLDNTLVEPCQELGSDQWFVARQKKYEKDGLSKKEAFEKTYYEWFVLQTITGSKTVEEKTKRVFDQIADKNMVLALTARSYDLSYPTSKMLDFLGINFKKNSFEVHDNALFFSEKEKYVLFKDGILLTSGLNKGIVLFKFLEKIGVFPKGIVFVDDKKTSLLQVEAEAEKRNIPFIGLRYGFLDEKVKKIQQEVIDIREEKLDFSVLLN